MVWTADQARTFLDYAAIHAPDLYPLFHFVTYRGLRRGEAVGLKEAEVRLDNRSARIGNQVTLGRDGYIHKRPKSITGNRDVYYDNETRAILTRYATIKAEQRLAAGPAWPNTGLFFVRPDGHAWNPQTVSQRLRRLISRTGLPPIRFHDLRHVAATIGLQAGVGIKVTQRATRPHHVRSDQRHLHHRLRRTPPRRRRRRRLHSPPQNRIVTTRPWPVPRIPRPVQHHRLTTRLITVGIRLASHAEGHTRFTQYTGRDTKSLCSQQHGRGIAPRAHGHRTNPVPAGTRRTSPGMNTYAQTGILDRVPPS